MVSDKLLLVDRLVPDAYSPSSQHMTLAAPLTLCCALPNTVEVSMSMAPPTPREPCTLGVPRTMRSAALLACYRATLRSLLCVLLSNQTAKCCRLGCVLTHATFSRRTPGTRLYSQIEPRAMSLMPLLARRCGGTSACP